jgi:transposase
VSSAHSSQRLPPEVLAQWITDRKKGLTYAEIGKKHGRSASTVYRHLRIHGGKKRTRRYSPPPSGGLITAMVKAYNGGLTYRETAEKSNVSYGKAHRYISADPRAKVRTWGGGAGADRAVSTLSERRQRQPRKVRRPEGGRPLSSDEVAQMIKDRNEKGMTYAALGEKYGVSGQTAHNHVGPHSATPARKRAPSPSPGKVAAMVDAYNGGLTFRETGKKFRVSTETARRHISADPRAKVRAWGGPPAAASDDERSGAAATTLPVKV